ADVVVPRRSPRPVVRRFRYAARCHGNPGILRRTDRPSYRGSVNRMGVEFVKSHGAGNDFVMIEDLGDRMGIIDPKLVAALCDRHQGVGADGLIRIAPADGADFFMDYYNADGGVAEMCGNGIRCLAKYVADRGMTTEDRLRV